MPIELKMSLETMQTIALISCSCNSSTFSSAPFWHTLYLRLVIPHHSSRPAAISACQTNGYRRLMSLFTNVWMRVLSPNPQYLTHSPLFQAFLSNQGFGFLGGFFLGLFLILEFKTTRFQIQLHSISALDTALTLLKNKYVQF